MYKLSIAQENTHALQGHIHSLSDTCRLSAGWRVLHDSASLSIPPGNPDDTAASVEATTAISTVIENYGTCNQYREQVIAWQDWVAKMVTP